MCEHCSEHGVGLSAPWYTLLGQVKALFEKDPEVEVSDSLSEITHPTEFEEAYCINIYSTNTDKLNAIERLLGNVRDFGNVGVYIVYNVPNENIQDVWNRAFAGNPIFSHVEVNDSDGFSAIYPVFKREILSFYNDDLSDYKRNAHYIAADLVTELAKFGVGYPSTEA